MSMHRGTPKSGPFLLQASQHEAGLYDWNDDVPEDEAHSRLRETLHDQPGHRFDADGMTHALQEYQRMRDDYHRHGKTAGEFNIHGPEADLHSEVDLDTDRDWQHRDRDSYPHDIGGELDLGQEYKVRPRYKPENRMSMHSGTPKSGPWLLEASRHFAYDIQSPAPGEPMQTQRGPKNPSSDPANDPMGHLESRPYDYPTMVNNLVSHYNGATDDERKKGRLWYKAAHDMFHKFAKDNNITPERSVAYGSAFSPMTDWGDNVHHAQQFMLGYNPGSPDFNEHDWQTAHIHPGALQAFREQTGHDPSDSDEDLHKLADLHSEAFSRGPKKDATNDLSNPDARASWMQNIQHKGMDAVLADHAQQKEAWRKSPKTTGEYNPSMAMRPSGIKTLGGNIQKAKDLYHSPEDVSQMFKVLGGPKISHFTDNILDDTPIDSEGYYQHPNGDWTQNKDLGGTIDSHHIRASSMPHGGWERKPYASKNPSTDHEYDVFNRGLLDATRHINAQEPDPARHITPKQLQAIVWLKHKNDKDFFERQRNPQTGQLITHESELGGVGRPEDWQFAEKSYKSKGKGLGKGPSRAAALEPEEFQNMPPLWRKMFMSRQPVDWLDLLHDYVQHYSPGHYQTEDPSFHEAAIESEWHNTAPVPKLKVGPRPKLKPRRPQAPRVEHNPRRASWYIDAIDRQVQEYGGGDELPVQPWFQPDYARDEFGGETHDFAVARDHAQYPGEKDPGFRMRLQDMQGNEMASRPAYKPDWQEFDPNQDYLWHNDGPLGHHPGDLSQRTSRWYLTADDSPAPGSDKEKSQENPTGMASGGIGGSQGAAMSGGDLDPHAYPMTPTSTPSSGGGSSSGGSSGGGGQGIQVEYSPSSGTEQWRADVAQGLTRNGLPDTPAMENQVLHQMQTESSGNPNAINNWDSNAAAGHPSQGLMQTIPSTFNQYHLPGDSMNINDPQANIDSAIGYGKATYGPTLMNNSGGGIGSGHGY